MSLSERRQMGRSERKESEEEGRLTIYSFMFIQCDLYDTFLTTAMTITYKLAADITVMRSHSDWLVSVSMGLNSDHKSFSKTAVIGLDCEVAVHKCLL